MRLRAPSQRVRVRAPQMETSLPALKNFILPVRWPERHSRQQG
jgi:hypothetical protein